MPAIAHPSPEPPVMIEDQHLAARAQPKLDEIRALLDGRSYAELDADQFRQIYNTWASYCALHPSLMPSTEFAVALVDRIERFRRGRRYAALSDADFRRLSQLWAAADLLGINTPSEFRIAEARRTGLPTRSPWQ